MQPVLERLAALVAFDTRNPPRAHTAKSPVFGYLREQRAGFTLHEWDHGDGSVTLLAVRGEPTTVFNYHLDTVPAADGWQRDPFELIVTDDRASGLGTCDIKGALAVMLDCAANSDGPLAILVTPLKRSKTAVLLASLLVAVGVYGMRIWWVMGGQYLQTFY